MMDYKHLSDIRGFCGRFLFIDRQFVYAKVFHSLRFGGHHLLLSVRYEYLLDTYSCSYCWVAVLSPCYLWWLIVFVN